MKKTLLDIVQEVMNDMSADFVNSIGATEESLQVAQVVKSTYEEMVTRRDWPHLKKLLPLISYGNNSYPTYLLVPENMRQIDWINYDQKSLDNPTAGFAQIKYLDPQKFIQFTNSRNTADNATEIVTTLDNVPFKIITNHAPTYWTSFDDKYIIMDSYNKDIEDTLQGKNAQVYMEVLPSWTMTDDFVPEMPIHLYPALLAEAKSACFYVIKTQANQKAEQISKRQQARMAQDGWRTNGGIKYPNYGRKQWK